MLLCFVGSTVGAGSRGGGETREGGRILDDLCVCEREREGEREREMEMERETIPRLSVRIRRRAGVVGS